MPSLSDGSPEAFAAEHVFRGPNLPFPLSLILILSVLIRTLKMRMEEREEREEEKRLELLAQKFFLQIPRSWERLKIWTLVLALSRAFNCPTEKICHGQFHLFSPDMGGKWIFRESSGLRSLKISGFSSCEKRNNSLVEFNYLCASTFYFHEIKSESVKVFPFYILDR